ncbi:DNA mismatch repair protein [Cooperia oncophora]
MVDIMRCLPTEDVCLDYGLNPKNTYVYADYTISGFVSSCEHGFGRSATDRQFVYVNQRPVDYPKVCRVVNEVYQQYNRSQYPTLVLNIEVPPNMIDVNVTPDKRMVFFEREKELLALIRSSILATYHPLLGAYTSVEDTRSKGNVSYLKWFKRMKGLAKFTDDDNCDDATKSNSNAPLSAHSALSSLLKSNSDKASSPACTVPLGPPPKKSKTDDFFPASKNLTNQSKTLDLFAFKPIPRESPCSAVAAQPSICSNEKPESSAKSATLSIHPSPSKPSKGTPKKKASDSFEEFSHEKKSYSPSLMRDLSRGFENNIEKDRLAIEKMETTMDQECNLEMRGQDGVMNHEEAPTSLNPTENAEKTNCFLRPQQKFHAGLNPSENELAEKELERTLRKSDFAQMSVIGQFNNGFIITRLRNNLFIVDQHASDEKYNFERFQKKARVETQRLIQPQHLDLGAVQASVLKDNLSILEANGFGFEFKEGDIEEILTVVSEFPGVMYRPAKLRRIFASRACRKSVMIGTTLTMAQMQNIVHHLGTLDQPWNCPHGRPTLRHLVDLQNINI